MSVLDVADNIDVGYTPYIDMGVMRRLLPTALKALRTLEFDALACRGVSGLIAAPILALELNKNLLIVRKSDERSHHNSCYGDGRLVQGDKAAKRYVIVDDFVSSGETAKTIVAEVAKFAPQAECLGILELKYMDAAGRWTLGGNYKLTPAPCLKPFPAVPEPVTMTLDSIPGERMFMIPNTPIYVPGPINWPGPLPSLPADYKFMFGVCPGKESV